MKKYSILSLALFLYAFTVFPIFGMYHSTYYESALSYDNSKEVNNHKVIGLIGKLMAVANQYDAAEFNQQFADAICQNPKLEDPLIQGLAKHVITYYLNNATEEARIASAKIILTNSYIQRYLQQEPTAKDVYNYASLMQVPKKNLLFLVATGYTPTTKKGMQQVQQFVFESQELARKR